MPELYPTGVPTAIQTGSLNGDGGTTATIRLNVDIGKAMARPKYSTDLFNVGFSILMVKSEIDILMDWYYNTLNKVLSFNFPDPLTGTDKEYYFNVPPSFVHIGVEQFLVTFNLRTSNGYDVVDVYPPIVIIPDASSSSLSKQMFYSFDLQNSFKAPTGVSTLPEHNNTRFK